MRIAITGSSGFIGSALVADLVQRGHEVVRLQRSAPKVQLLNTTFVPFDLRTPQLAGLPAVDALIHCAFMAYSPKENDAEQVNIAATQALREHCRQHGIHFIFLSTMSAHAAARSVYGRHKFQLEQLADLQHETVLKLGLVVGAEGGLFQRISTAIARSGVVPLVDGGRQPIQTIAIDELCEIVTRVVEGPVVGQFVLGSEQAITLRQLYAAIAVAKGRKLVFISLPYGLFDLALTVLGLLPVSLPVSKENLLGLKYLEVFETQASLQQLGMTLRPLEASIRRINTPTH